VAQSRKRKKDRRRGERKRIFEELNLYEQRIDMGAVILVQNPRFNLVLKDGSEHEVGYPPTIASAPASSVAPRSSSGRTRTPSRCREARSPCSPA